MPAQIRPGPSSFRLARAAINRPLLAATQAVPRKPGGSAGVSIQQRQKDRPEANGTWPCQWVHD